MKIESDIPMPLEQGKTGRPVGEASLLAVKMKTGDSVLVDNLSDQQAIRRAIYRNGGKAQSRKQEGGWRIWRIS